VQSWGLEVLCQEPKDFLSSLTAVLTPEGHDADAFRAGVLRQFIMSLGNGLSRLVGKVFRICYLGDFNDLMPPGTLSGVEMGLSIANIPPQTGDADAKMNMLKMF
jgi:alanine-glyoxylate transaminase/serine-glyoxylate transaminase/serine-pyruvate transaminase